MPRHDALLDRLQRVRREFLDTLDAMPADRRQQKPAPDVWSPLEIAEHTYRAERSTLGGIERQFGQGEARTDVGTPSTVRFLGLIVALRSPLRFKAPTRVRGLALEGIDLGAFRDEWLGFDARWRATRDRIPAELERGGVIRHPYAGALSFRHSLRFLVAHGERHLRQLKKRAA